MDMGKKITRWKSLPPLVSLTGSKKASLEDAEIAMLFGRICVAWPHFENAMISVFHKLLGVQQENQDTARLIFTSLVNQKIRVDVMRELLERSCHNRDKGEEFDTIIDEFKKLNELRNRYVHGRWWTHENGDTFLQSDNSVSVAHIEFRKVTKKEMQSFLDRLYALWNKIEWV